MTKKKKKKSHQLYCLGALKFKSYFHSKINLGASSPQSSVRAFSECACKKDFLKKCQRTDSSRIKKKKIWVEIPLYLKHVLDLVLKVLWWKQTGRVNEEDGRVLEMSFVGWAIPGLPAAAVVTSQSLSGWTCRDRSDLSRFSCYHILEMKSTLAPQKPWHFFSV